jgi:hypothetical protein
VDTSVVVNMKEKSEGSMFARFAGSGSAGVLELVLFHPGVCSYM